MVIKDAVDRLLQLLNNDTQRRVVIGLVGLPGSGKSTLTAKLVDAVNQRTNSGTAAALSMDGFHVTKAALAQFDNPVAALSRRGSPWTFDSLGLAAKLAQLRKMPYQSITWPDFQHGMGDPVADAISVTPQVRLIIVEGLYLLHREHGWNLNGLLDECWYLDTPMDVAMERLVKRHMASWGFSRGQALDRLAINDNLNADIVLQSRERADWLVSGDSSGHD
jgi:pantothenate kinase